MTDVLPAGLALDDLSPDIRPQDDLYRHVNGAWIARTEIPGDKARWGSFHLLAEQAEKDVRAIVEESQEAEEGTLARKIGDLFASFMDTDRIAAAGVTPLAETFAEIDAIDGIPAFLRTVGTYDREGRAAVIGLYVDGDPGNPERYLPVLVQAGLAPGRELLPSRHLRRDPRGVPGAPRAPARSRRCRRCRRAGRALHRPGDRARRAPLGQRAQP